MGVLLLVVILIATIFLFASLVLLPAGLAYYSRSSKRKKIMRTLPAEVIYTAPVRLNSPKKNDSVIKLKGFEYSGVLYILNDKVYVQGTKGQYSEFDLRETDISWPGVQIQNGLLEWLCLSDEEKKLYVNAETGVFIFRLSKKLPSSREIYDYLKTHQKIHLLGE